MSPAPLADHNGAEQNRAVVVAEPLPELVQPSTRVPSHPGTHLTTNIQRSEAQIDGS
ncbi:MAG: hypothetical protein LC749_04615 [Actinobacteria bacterium]|nr:hypothetical protein [Actinomycetota bacterium]